MQTHTGVSVQLYISDSDFNREPIDIAIRYGSSNDPEQVIRWCEVVKELPRNLVWTCHTPYLLSKLFHSYPNLQQNLLNYGLFVLVDKLSLLQFDCLKNK